MGNELWAIEKSDDGGVTWWPIAHWTGTSESQAIDHAIRENSREANILGTDKYRAMKYVSTDRPVEP